MWNLPCKFLSYNLLNFLACRFNLLIFFGLFSVCSCFFFSGYKSCLFVLVYKCSAEGVYSTPCLSILKVIFDRETQGMLHDVPWCLAVRLWSPSGSGFVGSTLLCSWWDWICKLFFLLLLCSKASWTFKLVWSMWRRLSHLCFYL